MTIMDDGIEIFCLPDTARCKAAGCDPFDVDECPRGMDVCEPGSCDCYTEEEFEKDPDREYELARDRDEI